MLHMAEKPLVGPSRCFPELPILLQAYELVAISETESESSWPYCSRVMHLCFPGLSDISLLSRHRSADVPMLQCVKVWAIGGTLLCGTERVELRKRCNPHERGLTGAHPTRFGPHVESIYGYRSEITGHDAVPPRDPNRNSSRQAGRCPLSWKIAAPMACRATAPTICYRRTGPAKRKDGHG